MIEIVKKYTSSIALAKSNKYLKHPALATMSAIKQCKLYNNIGPKD